MTRSDCAGRRGPQPAASGRVARERAALRRDIEDAEAQLGEWTARISADGVLDFYGRLGDLVTSRVAQADGVAEINAVLHPGAVDRLDAELQRTFALHGAVNTGGGFR